MLVDAAILNLNGHARIGILKLLDDRLERLIGGIIGEVQCPELNFLRLGGHRSAED